MTIFYSESECYDFRCVGKSRHLFRSPYIPKRCPVVTQGWCDATTFDLVDPKKAEQERAALKPRGKQNEPKRYER